MQDYREQMATFADLRVELHKTTYCNPEVLSKMEEMFDQLEFVTNVSHDIICGRITFTINISRKELNVPNSASCMVIRDKLVDAFDTIFQYVLDQHNIMYHNNINRSRLYDIIVFPTNIAQVIL